MRLNERERRLFIACKVTGPNGCAIRPLCTFLGVSTRTVVKGIHELRDKTCLEGNRIRKPGGGAKKKTDTHPEWKKAFLELASKHMAGDPQDEGIVWPNIKTPAIRCELQKQGIDISDHLVRQLVSESGFKTRSAPMWSKRYTKQAGESPTDTWTNSPEGSSSTHNSIIGTTLFIPLIRLNFFF